MDEPPDPRAEIVAYLRAHPSAADSLEGIITWWLPRQRYEMARQVIQRALEDLAREGIVDEIAMSEGPHLYRLARRREPQE